MIRLNVPFTDERELQEIAQVLASGYMTQGPKTAEFEKRVAAYIGCRHAFATSSCTTALHLGLVAANLQPGDEVLVADFTFPATANVVVQQGAIPVLVDIDLDTYTLNLDDLRAKITPRSKVIIPVDAFGCAADMDGVNDIARTHKLLVLEDAATAIGTQYYEQYCGNLSDMGAFSFHPRKVITTGEGGMLTTNDDALAEKIQLLRSHGGVRAGHWFEYEAAGFNYRLSDIHGAMGIAQMEKLPWLIERKRALAQQLCERLQDVPDIALPRAPRWGGHIYQSFVILVNENIDRNRAIEFLRAHGVEATLGTYALHAQPFYQRAFGYVNGQLPNSYRAFTKTITLPLYPQMTPEELEMVATQTRAAILEQSKS